MSTIFTSTDYNNEAIFTIPNSITSIGNNAFNGATSLASVDFEPNSLLTTIGNQAFKQTNITSITIPNSVTSIGANAFQNTYTLSLFTFESGSTLETIGNNAFLNSGITTIYAGQNLITSQGWDVNSDNSIGGKGGITVIVIEEVPVPIPIILFTNYVYLITDGSPASYTIPDSFTGIDIRRYSYGCAYQGFIQYKRCSKQSAYRVWSSNWARRDR